MSKNLTTRTTIENLAAELKKRFAAAEAGIALSFKSGKVDGNTVSFYTSADRTGAAAFTLDFPAEMFLDQTKTRFAPKFAFSEETYAGAADPKLDGKPVMVLAVKGDGDAVTYSFLDMAALVDTYSAKVEGKDASTAVEISGYEVEVKVNISGAEGNALLLKDDGLYVGSARVEGATEGNLAGLNADGSLSDSGVAAGKVLTQDDISDYTAEEIAALLDGSAE